MPVYKAMTMKHCVRTLILLFSLLLAIGAATTPALGSVDQSIAQQNGLHTQHIDTTQVINALCYGNCQQHCPQQASGCGYCDGCAQGCDPGLVSIPAALVIRTMSLSDVYSGIKRQQSDRLERPPKKNRYLI